MPYIQAAQYALKCSFAKQVAVPVPQASVHQGVDSLLQALYSITQLPLLYQSLEVIHGALCGHIVYTRAGCLTNPELSLGIAQQLRSYSCIYIT